MSKVMSPDEALGWREREAEAGHVVVFTNGVFDLLHVGHLRYLEAARQLGDSLIVGVNGDESVHMLKPGRPIVAEPDRAELVSGLACVDVVVIFQSAAATQLVMDLHPDIYVKGGDWGHPGGPRPPEAAAVARYGGRVVYIPLTPEHSTSTLIERIRALDLEQK